MMHFADECLRLNRGDYVRMQKSYTGYSSLRHNRVVKQRMPALLYIVQCEPTRKLDRQVDGCEITCLLNCQNQR